MGATRTLDAHACRLRKKLRLAGAAGHIVNKRSVGYRLVDRAPAMTGEVGAEGGGPIALQRITEAA